MINRNMMRIFSKYCERCGTELIYGVYKNNNSTNDRALYGWYCLHCDTIITVEMSVNSNV